MKLMKNKKICPECTALLDNANRCACGWAANNTNSSRIDDRCSFQIRKTRCPLPGTVTLGVKNSNWLCTAHFVTQNDYKLSEALLIEINCNIQEWSSPMNWRVQILKDKLTIYSHPYTAQKKDMNEIVMELKKRILWN